MERWVVDVVLLPYEGNDAWIEPTLSQLKACLDAPEIPKPADDCEFCGYAAARAVREMTESA